MYAVVPAFDHHPYVAAVDNSAS